VRSSIGRTQHARLCPPQGCPARSKVAKSHLSHAQSNPFENSRAAVTSRETELSLLTAQCGTPEKRAKSPRSLASQPPR